MRRSVFLPILAASLTFELAAAAPVRIAVLGDSLALGVGAHAPDGGFIFRAFRTLDERRPGSTIDSFAMGGATVADVLRLQVARLRAGRYDVAIVCVGGNDVVSETAPTAFAVGYRRLLAAIRAAAPHARVVCCGVPDVALSPIFADESATIARLSRRDDAAVRACARAAGASFVDLFAVTHAQHGAAARFLSADRFHPSDRGYVLLAAALEPALARAVGKG